MYLFGSGKLILVDPGTGARNKQNGRARYEASTWFTGQDSDKYQCQILWPIKH